MSTTRLRAFYAAAVLLRLALAAFSVRPKGADSLYGYMDRTVKVVIEGAFEPDGAFRGGVAHVYVVEGRAYIDREGNFIWKPGM